MAYAIDETMQFDFDNIESNKRPVTRQPAIKVINQDVKEDGKFPGGFFIAEDNMDAARWRHDIDLKAIAAKPFQVKTKKQRSDGKGFLKVSGIVITAPRILVLRQSPLLGYLVTKEGNIDRTCIGLWRKREELSYPEGYSAQTHKYEAVTMYMVMLLDADNQMLHTVPLQLSARGFFAVEFAKKLKEFRLDFERAYFATKGKEVDSTSLQMNEKWHSFGVFCPQFQLDFVGKGDTINTACITKDYVKPTPESFKSLCVAYSDIASIVADNHEQTLNFWHKVFNKQRQEDATAPMGQFERNKVKDIEDRLMRLSHRLNHPISRIKQKAYEIFGKTYTQMTEEECLQLESLYVGAIAPEEEDEIDDDIPY